MLSESHRESRGWSASEERPTSRNKWDTLTAKHYAHWSGDEESEPLRRELGEVRADLIARRGRESDFVTSLVTSSPTPETADRLTAREVGRKLVELGGIEPPTLRLPEESEPEETPPLTLS